MFKTSLYRTAMISLAAICFMGFTFNAQAAEAPQYHLGDIEPGPTGKPPKPAALFRHLLYNFHKSEYHNPVTFKQTAIEEATAAMTEKIVAGMIAAGKVASPGTAPMNGQLTVAGAKVTVSAQVQAGLDKFFSTQDQNGITVAQKLTGLYSKMFQAFNGAFFKEVGQAKPVFDEKTGTLKEGIAMTPAGPQVIPADQVIYATTAYTESQRLFRMMLLISRGFHNDFFAELRRHEPAFSIPGDDQAGPVDRAKLAKQGYKVPPVPQAISLDALNAQGGKIRAERASYLITRYKNIAYGYGYTKQKDPTKYGVNDAADAAANGYGENWSPIAVERTVPPFTNVIYSRAVLYYGKMEQFVVQSLGAMLNLMDYATGGYLKSKVVGTNNWPVDVNGKFMLGTKAELANAEKAYLHKITNRIQKMNEKPGVLEKGVDGRKASMDAVREVVAWYVKEAMKNKATDKNVDFARDISRHAAMGMVADYFGFYPPDVNSQIQWSRNTQNSFFHNIFDFKWYDHLAMKSGEEMAAYIEAVLTPAYKTQLKNGRPTSDTVSMMIEGHAEIPKPVKAAFNLNDQRIMATTMGLLVGAGETTTMAVNFALYELMTRAAKEKADPKNNGESPLWNDFVETAKLAESGNEAAREKFYAYIWEALRFKPVNPWTERKADKTETLKTCTESYYALPQGKKAPKKVKSTCSNVTVTNGSRVLFVTQSAMFDPDMKLIGGSSEKDPWKFSLERGNDNYIHFAFGYHRCLGDDVAQAMTPEIILQVVANVDGLEINPVNNDVMMGTQTVPVEPGYLALLKMKGVNFPAELKGERTPFPETFPLTFSGKSAAVTRSVSPMAKAFDYLENELGSKNKYSKVVKAGLAYVAKTQSFNSNSNEAFIMDGVSGRVLNNGLNRFDIEAFKQQELVLEELEAKLAASNYQPWRTCANKWQVDDYGDGFGKASSTRKEICNMKTRFKKFNACYFVQRTLGQLSTKNAFNKCAYEPDANGFFRFSGTKNVDDIEENLNMYLDIVKGKGDFYWVKWHQAAK